MLKGEIIQLHTILFKIRRILECAGFRNEYFSLYDELGVYPLQVHKRKSDHKKAIFILCLGILEIFKEKPKKVFELMELINPNDSTISSSTLTIIIKYYLKNFQSTKSLKIS
ncbi:MAG: hypothetical protein DRP88_05315 [Candidatus Neomarinimicrobiota bacterium]|nr:MAG: hypothetical protein DRP88_05315 [Candidatus Neomarinimicrobiota bacterium]